MPTISLTVGPLYTNCYIVFCEKTHEALIIDPGFTEEEWHKVLSKIRENGLRIKYIINTHGHVDHISGNSKIKEATGAILATHFRDIDMLIDPAKNLSLMLGLHVVSPLPDMILRGGEEIRVGHIKLKVLHTPGHTPGSISLHCKDLEAIFTGDTLFAGSIGRTDFPGSSHRDLMYSIKKKILVLPDETVVYPGHGGSTSVGIERRFNLFLL